MGNKPFATPSQAGFVLGMPSTAELIKLPVAERLALIDELWTSISDADFAVEPGQVEEAQGRWAELKANPAIGLSYDEIKRRLGHGS